MKTKFVTLWESLLDIFDSRVSVTQLAKPEDLVISNAPLKNIKKGINKVYRQVYAAENKK
ncbi:hypothetical protein B14911_16805 [Bacillus sp. NRRL B-14911]|uniref:Uncharacterized protein n=1 Tax=Bacillus infantis NRRL B-14911 TaxID=1367477 RepID=U5L511_9BACI|nr:MULTISPECIES: hypothetical protein [Bacillus]AGX02784.1 hypothetical protein N288_04135 [Bacillus infantis NRRL B-14911]EAR67192.1 hypothetical protein B14911_16805 [Bacillus sp. NRRL B-14911]